MHLGAARPDTERRQRTHLVEAVLAEHKSRGELKTIIDWHLHEKRDLLMTRLRPEDLPWLRDHYPSVRRSERGRLAWQRFSAPMPTRGRVAVISAGTSDRGVLLEAVYALRFHGSRTLRIEDAGVAGLHRILGQVDKLREVTCAVVIAGMDGALPSVVAGLTGLPVFAVPTSNGYGANFQGLAPLLAMLSSCAPGVSALNIDNGFGAGCLAHLVNRRMEFIP